MQREPSASGQVMFLHSNNDKWGMELPHEWADYTRRWQVRAGGAFRTPDLGFEGLRVLGLHTQVAGACGGRMPHTGFRV